LLSGERLIVERPAGESNLSTLKEIKRTRIPEYDIQPVCPTPGFNCAGHEDRYYHGGNQGRNIKLLTSQALCPGPHREALWTRHTIHLSFRGCTVHGVEALLSKRILRHLPARQCRRSDLMAGSSRTKHQPTRKIRHRSPEKVPEDENMEVKVLRNVSRLGGLVINPELFMRACNKRNMVPMMKVAANIEHVSRTDVEESYLPTCTTTSNSL
jgi:hypothetical protein